MPGYPRKRGTKVTSHPVVTWRRYTTLTGHIGGRHTGEHVRRVTRLTTREEAMDLCAELGLLPVVSAVDRQGRLGGLGVCGEVLDAMRDPGG